MRIKKENEKYIEKEVIYSNSTLVDFVRLSPNKSNGRKHLSFNPTGKIDKITIHHTAGKLSIENLGRVFSKEKKKASANYGVGDDGRVGLFVPESERSWASSNVKNDYRAVTIDVVNSKKGGDWEVGDVALAKTIELCIDICKRNGIRKINFTGDENGNLTMHKYFTNTTCPGPYLESKFPYIAEEINKGLQK